MTLLYSIVISRDLLIINHFYFLSNKLRLYIFYKLITNRVIKYIVFK